MQTADCQLDAGVKHDDLFWQSFFVAIQTVPKIYDDAMKHKSTSL